MHKSKLLTLIRGVKSVELRKFHKFLQSPYYNSNQTVIQLFEYLKKYYPDFESPKLSKETVHKKLYPSQKYNVQRIRKLMHELTILTEDFIVAQHCREDEEAKKRILTQEFSRRNLYDIYTKNIEEIREDLQQKPHRDEKYYHERLYWSFDYFAHPTTVNGKKSEEKLKEMLEDLDAYYFIRKLYIACALLSFHLIYKTKTDFSFIDEIIEKVEKSNLNKITLIRLLVSLSVLYRNVDKKELFDEIFNDFIENKEDLNLKNREFILKYLLNYTTFYINKGVKSFVRKNFNLFKIGLGEDLLIKNNRITESTFKNIVVAGAFLKEFEWTENFIHHHQQYLDEGVREQQVKLNSAILNFNAKKYNIAIELLSSTLFRNLSNKLLVKTLLMKCHFEIFLNDDSYYDLLNCEIESFEKYIRRENSLSESRKENYLNLIKYSKKLLNIRMRKTEVGSLTAKISSVSSLSNRPWVLSVAERIGKA